jgi:glycerophosphoryl diester phosphodiesterase
MLVAAHRGTRIHAPENSRQALISGYTAGADALEFDVQMTKDGKLVISHDGTTDRLTGEEGTILDQTLHQLRHTAGKYDFSATFNPYEVDEFRYYRPGRRLQIEPFEDMLDVLPRDVVKLVEMKPESSPDAATRKKFVTAVIEALRVRHMFGECVVFSSDPENVKLAKQLAPEVRTAVLVWDKSDAEMLQLVRDTGADGLVTDVAKAVSAEGKLTKFAASFSALYAELKLKVGLMLYPHRDPGVFLSAEFEALSPLPYVFSLSTDSMLGAEVEGEFVDVQALLGRDHVWIDAKFAGKGVDRDTYAFGYAKANRWCRISQDNGVHIENLEYDGWLPGTITGDPIKDELERLKTELIWADKSWPFYSGGGVGTIRGIRGPFAAEVDYEMDKPMTQAQTLEMAAVNVDPGTHQPNPPRGATEKDTFYDPHGCPPYVGVEHDENDGYRINWNLGHEYDSNQYGPPCGNGQKPMAGRIRLERRGPYFSAYYRNEVDAPDWICVGAVRNTSMNDVVHLRCAAKRWLQENDDESEKQGKTVYYDVQANRFTFRNLVIRKFS